MPGPPGAASSDLESCGAAEHEANMAASSKALTARRGAPDMIPRIAAMLPSIDREA